LSQPLTVGKFLESFGETLGLSDIGGGIGLDTETTTILGVQIPLITVPLNPGKNITVIAEVIALNHLLRYSGINPAEVFNERLIGRMRRAAAGNVRDYLQEDEE
jgi:HPr kinase/phosphorylase